MKLGLEKGFWKFLFWSLIPEVSKLETMLQSGKVCCYPSKGHPLDGNCSNVITTNALQLGTKRTFYTYQEGHYGSLGGPGSPQPPLQSSLHVQAVLNCASKPFLVCNEKQSWGGLQKELQPLWTLWRAIVTPSKSNKSFSPLSRNP